jgi:hypothetical protein
VDVTEQPKTSCGHETGAHITGVHHGTLVFARDDQTGLAGRFRAPEIDLGKDADGDQVATDEGQLCGSLVSPKLTGAACSAENDTLRPCKRAIYWHLTAVTLASVQTCLSCC